MHSPEPWKVNENLDNQVVSDWGVIIAETFRDRNGALVPRGNARRIVACVNACTGIPTDVLEKGRLSRDAFQLEETRADLAEQHRDDLLAVLERLFDIGSVHGSSIEADNPFVCGFEEWEKTARAAIAKAKGGAA